MKRPAAEARVVSSLGIATLTFLVFPQIVVAAASLDPGIYFQFPPSSLSLYWYQQFLSDDAWRSSLALTLTIAVSAAVAATVIGGGAGIAVARVPQKIRWFFYFLLVTPLVFPTIVVAISYYGVALRLHLVGTLLAYVTANTMLTSPLIALLVVGTALGVDPKLEFASLSLGAGRWRTLWRITVPVVAPTALVGGFLAFLITLDEVVVSSFIVGPDTIPLAVKMFFQVQTGTPPIVLAASTFLIVASIVIVGSAVFLNQLMRTRRGAPALEVMGPIMLPVES
jgi:putative spermidine/putrescine transport system permease protein